jgi:hypothetical protein
MAAVATHIDDDLAAWIGRQPVFFVASAPCGPGGHVNLSPKGLDTFAVLGPARVAYLDLTGSGVETIAHVRENGRITIMFCAFIGDPMILRLFGAARVYELGTPEFAALAPRFPEPPGRRAIIDVAVERVQTSCGYGVPEMDVRGQRSRLTEWAAARGDAGLAEYRAGKNASSIDGLPGFVGPAPARRDP